MFRYTWRAGDVVYSCKHNSGGHAGWTYWSGSTASSYTWPIIDDLGLYSYNRRGYHECTSSSSALPRDGRHHEANLRPRNSYSRYGGRLSTTVESIYNFEQPVRTTFKLSDGRRTTKAGRGGRTTFANRSTHFGPQREVVCAET